LDAIEQLDDGEHMFVADGLKISAQGDVAAAHVTQSRVGWWLVQRSYRRWRRRIERALAGG